MLLALRHSAKPCCGLSVLCWCWRRSGRWCFWAVMKKSLVDLSASASSSPFRVHNSHLPWADWTRAAWQWSQQALLLCLEWFCLFAVFSSFLGSTRPAFISSLEVESLSCVFLFCSYVARYILESWFRLMISNVTVGYKTKVKSCRFLCSNLCPAIFVLPYGPFAVFSYIRIPVAQLN